MSDEIQTQFPQYDPPKPKGHQFIDRKQTSPLFKMAKMMLKMPKRKVLQRRNRVTKKKFRIL